MRESKGQNPMSRAEPPPGGSDPASALLAARRARRMIIGLVAVAVVLNVGIALGLWQLAVARQRHAQQAAAVPSCENAPDRSSVEPATPLVGQGRPEEPSSVKSEVTPSVRQEAVVPQPVAPKAEVSSSPRPETSIAPKPKRGEAGGQSGEGKTAETQPSGLVPPASGAGREPTKAAPPQAPVEILSPSRFTAKPQDVLPVSEAKETVEFAVKAFDAVLKSPPAIEKLVSYEQAGNELVVKHVSVRGGMGAVRFLRAKLDPQGGRILCEPLQDAAKDYPAWLAHYVLVVADRATGSVYQCRRSRPVATREVALAYHDDGTLGAAAEEKSWSFTYPWPEALLIQHKNLDDGAAAPLVIAAPRGKPAPNIEFRSTYGDRLSTELVLRRSIQLKDKTFPVSLILRLAREEAVDPEGARKVRVSVAHVGLSEYLASVTAPMEQLRKVRNDLPTAEKEVDKATVDCERCRDTIRDIQRDLDSEPVYTYTYETAMQKERRLARLDQFRSNLRKARSTLGDLVDKENRLKERVAALKARIAKLETATATFDQDIGLPEGQFQDPGALTVLDPWGAPLVQLTPKLRHEAGKATTLDVPKAPDPVKTPDPFKTPTVPKKRPTRSVF